MWVCAQPGQHRDTVSWLGPLMFPYPALLWVGVVSPEDMLK